MAAETSDFDRLLQLPQARQAGVRYARARSGRIFEAYNLKKKPTAGPLQMPREVLNG